MKDVKNLSNYFLFGLLIISLYFAFVIFKPYIAVIILAAIFASIFYPLYKWILKRVKEKETIASLLTILIFILVVLIPLTNFVALLVKESIETYPIIAQKIGDGGVENVFTTSITEIEAFQERYLPFIDSERIDIKELLLDLGSSFSRFIVDNADKILNRTTQFIISLFFMLITMYYLLKDGEKFVARLMYLTPLPNKYDRKLFKKFREVSKATILSSLLTAVIQGVLAATAYFFVGYPAFFLGVATAIASVIPIVGTGLVWLPVTIVLAVSGNLGGAIFMILWGVIVIGLSDNLIRTKMIESKSNIHPILVFFSIFGGLAAFGFLGIVFGPLILAIILTVIHIYELEYAHVLEK